MQDDCPGSRVARMPWFWDQVDLSTRKPHTAPSLEDATETTTFQQFPQQRGVPESSCVAYGFQESKSGRFPTEVAERINRTPDRLPGYDLEHV